MDFGTIFVLKLLQNGVPKINMKCSSFNEFKSNRASIMGTIFSRIGQNGLLFFIFASCRLFRFPLASDVEVWFDNFLQILKLVIIFQLLVTSVSRFFQCIWLLVAAWLAAGG